MIATRLLPRHPATRLTLAVITIHFGFVLWWIFTTFAVIDEVGHLGSGLASWRTFNMRPYCVNPPLPRMIATLPIWAEDPNLSVSIDEKPGMRSEWKLGTSLARDNPDRYISLLRHARLANLVWTALAIGVLWRWSGEQYGPWGRLIVVSLWCLDPTVIAFSGVVVPDVAAAACGLLACYLFWRYLREPGWYTAWLAGLALGLALLTKTTWLILFAVWPLLIGMARWGPRADVAERPRFRHLPLMIVAGWLVLCFGYGFTKFGRPLGDFEFISRALAGPEAHSGDTQQPKPSNRFRATALERVPVPLPADLIIGIDIQKFEFESKYPSYLNGEWRDHGWWYYYLYAMAIKLSVPTLSLILAGVFWCLAAPRSVDRLDEWAFLLPAIAVLAFVSSQTGFNHHMRYVLPAFPLLFLSAGRLVELAQDRKWLRGVIAGSLLWCFTAAASVAPYFMSYFNPLGGGPENGWRHLVDSNIDWGQDILHLKTWLDEHPEVRPIGVSSYNNLLQPKDAGIDAVAVPEEPTPGYYAVCVNYVAGSTYGRKHLLPGTNGPYAYFQRLTPIAKAGYSMYIYHITPADANRVRAEMGLPPWVEGSP